MNSLTIKFLFLGLLVFVCFGMVACGDDDNPVPPPPPPPNKMPVINTVTVSPTTVQTNGTATITVDASDPDGDALTYSYAPASGSVTGSGSSVQWTVGGVAGATSCMVTVSDGEATSLPKSGAITVTASPTLVTGTVTLRGGLSGNLTNMVARLWEWPYPDDPFIRYTQVIDVDPSGTTGSYAFTNIPAGSYLVDVYLDVDASGWLDAGDLYGWYNSGMSGGNIVWLEIIVRDNQMTQANVWVCIVCGTFCPCYPAAVSTSLEDLNPVLKRLE